MTLAELIRRLEAMPQDARLPIGIEEPHSYRGYYEQLAFEPAPPMTASEALEIARSAIGQKFEGYKGGTYKMGLDTDCWLAEYGCTSKEGSIEAIFGDEETP